MQLYRFNDRAVWVFRNNAAEFVRQYTSNTPQASRNAFLDIRGKIVAAYDQKFVNENEIWASFAAAYADKLKQHLAKYLFLMDTRIEEQTVNVFYDIEKGTCVMTGEDLPAPVTEEEFTLFRLKSHNPLQGIDFQDELLLEVDETEMVSFTKGCYLGQEIIARVHSRGKPSRKLVVLTEEEAVRLNGTPLTSKMKDHVTGKLIGFTFIKNT